MWPSRSWGPRSPASMRGFTVFTSSNLDGRRARDTRRHPLFADGRRAERYVVPSTSALMRARVVSMPALSSTSCCSMPPRANRGGDLGQDGALAVLELAPLGDQGAVAVRLEVVRPGVGGAVDVEREAPLGLELGDPAGAGPEEPLALVEVDADACRCPISSPKNFWRYVSGLNSLHAALVGHDLPDTGRRGVDVDRRLEGWDALRHGCRPFLRSARGGRWHGR